MSLPLTCKKHFNVAGQGGANSDSFIYCWIVYCKTNTHIINVFMFYV